MIRPVTRGDTEPFYFMVHKNRESLETYFSMTVHHTSTLNNTRVYVDQKIREASEHEFMLMMIHDERGRHIGAAHVKNFDRFVKKCEISYFIDKDLTNRGYATRSIKELIQYIFSKMDINKITCRIDPGNKASIRVAEKSGFKLEGKLKKEFKTGQGDVIDVLYYGVFKERFTL
jgi:RimJ/RimL family protein N-acetyltransferase